MHIVSTGDSLHEMSNPAFCKKQKQENYHQFVVCWISCKSGLGYNQNE